MQLEKQCENQPLLALKLSNALEKGTKENSLFLINFGLFFRHEKAAQERLYVKRERSQIKSDRKSVQLEEFN